MAEEVGGIVGSVYLDTTGIDPALRKLQSALDVSAGSTTRLAQTMPALNTGMVSVGRGANSAAMQMLLLGQFVDDVQYGFRAIVNQIPQMTLAFGGTAGLAGGLAIAGVAVNQLMIHWNDLIKVFDSSSSATENAAQEMERLGKVTHKTAEEQERYNKLKKEEQQIEQQRAGKSAAEQATEGAVGKTIQAAGYEKTVELLRLVERSRVGGLKMTGQDTADLEAAKERRAEINRLQSQGLPPNPITMLQDLMKGNVEEVTKRITERLQAEEKGGAERVLQAAQFNQGPAGDAARARLAGMAKEHPEFDAALQGLLEAAREPIRKQMQEVDDHMGKVFKGMRDEADKWRDLQRKTTDHMGDVFRDMRAEDDKKRDIARKTTDHMGDVFKDMQKQDDNRRDALREQDDHMGKVFDEMRGGNAVERAMDKLPGFDIKADRAYTQALVATGGDAEAARKRLAKEMEKELIAGGLNPEQAKDEAEKRSRQTARGVNEDIMQRALKGETKGSEIFGLDEMQRRLEGATTSADSGMMTAKNTEDMKQQLADILNAMGNFNLAKPTAKR